MRLITIFLVIYYIFVAGGLASLDLASFLFWGIALPLIILFVAIRKGKTLKDRDRLILEREKRIAKEKKMSDKSYNIKNGTIIFLGLWLGSLYLYNDIAKIKMFLSLEPIQLNILYGWILFMILFDAWYYQWDYDL